MFPTFVVALSLSAPPPAQAPVFEPPDPAVRPGDRPTAIAFSRDGKRMAVSHAGSDSKGTNNRVVIYDTPTWVVGHTLTGSEREYRHLAFSADGTELFGGGFDDKVYVWDTRTGRLSNTLPVDARECVSLMLSPDGNFLVSRHTRYQKKPGKFQIQVWEVNTRKRTVSIVGDESLSSFATSVTPDSRVIATCVGKSYAREEDGFFGIVEYDIGTGQEQNRVNAVRVTPGANPGISRLVYSLDGTRMYVGGGEKILKSDKTYRFSGYLWETNRNTGKVLNTVLSDLGDWVDHVALSSDGKVLYATAGSLIRQEILPNGKPVSHARGIIRAFETSSWKPLWDHETEFPNHSGLLLSPAGTRLAVAGDPGLFLLDTATGKKKAGLIEVGMTDR
jgi:WD40 repeat protein